MDDTKKPALTGAERQARYAAKRRSVPDAERRAYYRQREAILLERYRATLAIELALNPQSRAADLFKRRVEELVACQTTLEPAEIPAR